MKRQTLPTLTLLALVLVACPLGPKDGERDDGKAEGTEAKTDETGAPPVPAAAEPEAGAEALSCEDELAKVTAELAACEASK